MLSRQMWEPWPVRCEGVSQQLRVSPQPVETPWRFPAMRWWLPGWIVFVSSSLRSRLWRIQKTILQGRKKEEINNHGTILDPAQLSAELNRRCALMIMPINCQFPFICCVSLSSLLPCCIRPNSDILQTRKCKCCKIQAVSEWQGDFRNCQVLVWVSNTSLVDLWPDSELRRFKAIKIIRKSTMKAKMNEWRNR